MTIAVGESRKILCIWHDFCTDGMASAWVVHHKFGAGNVEFFGGAYGQPAPCESLIKGKDIYLVDFSYDIDTMRKMAKLANSVTILDHHKSAELAIQPLLDEGIVQGTFASDKSGALLTWAWLFPDDRPPILLEHVSDRDLWKFDLDDSREVEAALSSYPMEIDTWDQLMVGSLGDYIKEGKAILRSQRQKIKQHLVSTQRTVELAGYRVPMANVPYAWASEAGELMYANKPFSISFVIQRDNVKFSLRSAKHTGVDVREIAEIYGGGGHNGAAGFETDFEFLKDLCATEEQS
jgi:oligoribonuclease NrnB/cAMP/cGMP phosphodiesterase (DHH superfamily)